MLGSGDGVPVRGVHDHDSTLACCRYIYIIQADSGPPDDLQAIGRFKDVGSDLGGAPDNKAVVKAYYPFQFFRGKAGIDVYINSGCFLEKLYSHIRQQITY